MQEHQSITWHTNRYGYLITFVPLLAVPLAYLVARLIPWLSNVVSSLTGIVLLSLGGLVWLGLTSRRAVLRVGIGRDFVVLKYLLSMKRVERGDVERVEMEQPLEGNALHIDFREKDIPVSLRLKDGSKTHLVLMTSGLKRKILDRLGYPQD